MRSEKERSRTYHCGPAVGQLDGYEFFGVVTGTVET